MNFEYSLPPHFRLSTVIASHGWCDLHPFSTDEQWQTLTFACVLSGDRPVRIEVRQSGRSLRINAEGPAIGANARKEIVRVVRDVLRIDHDLSAFYRMTRTHRELQWIPRIGAGRILRAPTVFEDTVKMLCTTNCSWSLTKSMVSRLCDSLGVQVGDRKTFPTPAAMAGKKESFYRNVIKAGYRSPYLVELARRVDEGTLNLERLREPGTPTDEKRGILGSIKGIGPYASDNILRLHEVYDTFAHDSWIRPEFAKRYHKGRTVTDKTIERRYALFGEWRGLVYWMDMTRTWYEGRFRM